jgi:hypothetical protein
MPIAAAELFARVDLTIRNRAKWGQPVLCDDPGIYAICLSNDPSLNAGLLPHVPVSLELVEQWVRSVPTFSLGATLQPSPKKVAAFLDEFWFSDENIVYIGKATCLSKRLGQFRRHRLGQRSPHAGGHPRRLEAPMERFGWPVSDATNARALRASDSTKTLWR